jgi:hypothetical protein
MLLNRILNPNSVFAVLCIWTSLGVATSIRASGQSAPQPSPPIVSLEVAETRYCRGFGGGDELRVLLGIALHNSRSVPIVVFTGQPIVTEVDLAADAETMAAGILVTRQDGILTLFENRSIGKDDFRVLKPGESWSSKLWVPLLIAGSEHTVEATAGLPGPGKYLLRLVLGAWRFDRDATEFWSRRWAEAGELWTGTVATQTVPVTIEEHPRLESCGG